MTATASKAKTKTFRYLVKIDQAKCISSASCVSIAPDTFQLNNQQKSEVRAQEADSDDLKLQAAQACPAGAITIIDRETKQVVWPESDN